jgi:hypothetical protein
MTFFNKLALVLSFSLFAFVACQQQVVQEVDDSPVGYGGWLKGSSQEKFEEVAHQIQGFSRTMWEVSYRYNELYFAGMDENWGFAEYMLEHIDEALEQGYIRRPEREQSGKHFQEVIIPSMYEAIESEDKEEFIKAFEIMRVNCNACHAMEEVPFITVQTPKQRNLPIWP